MGGASPAMTRQKIGGKERPFGYPLGALQLRQRGFINKFKPEFRRSPMLATALALLAAISLGVSGASPARADRCDDLAAQLKGQVDGLKVGITAANVIYLSHPQAQEITIGCRGRNYSNELYAKADSRKPKKEFFDLVGSAAAIVFTVPKD